jgi:hypothetical protein
MEGRALSNGDQAIRGYDRDLRRSVGESFWIVKDDELLNDLHSSIIIADRASHSRF